MGQGVREISIIVVGTLLESTQLCSQNEAVPGRELLARVPGASILAYDGEGGLRFR